MDDGDLQKTFPDVMLQAGDPYYHCYVKVYYYENGNWILGDYGEIAVKSLGIGTRIYTLDFLTWLKNNRSCAQAENNFWGTCPANPN
jgi:hypothetical protein